MDLRFIALVSGAVVLFAIIRAVEVKRNRRRRATFDEFLATRSALPDADFAAGCGESIDRCIAERVREVLAKLSADFYFPAKHPIEPHLLRPDDQLERQLGFDLDSLSHLELIYRLEAEFGQPFPESIWSSYDYSKPPTVRDIVRVVAAELDARRQTD